ncbi:hypothetical protein RR48_05789 [Papilio machaon]|uniref:pyruvate dehydrogenase (acetyl-transferring) n=1 Tax=Papilio machaon TaxID=76193 RepID=A0A0N1IPX9_PAPMA|nr:hypothetical protein RR48_05789 [Papilio machaon]
MYKEKLIRGFCHLYTGQEAVAVGIHSMLRKVDTVVTSYRCHGWAQLMSGDMFGVLAEIAGCKAGRSRGKGGSMHIYAKNFYGGNAIVGSQIALGAGIAFAHKYRNDGGVCFAVYGDGAANQGQAFEAYNIDPYLYFCVGMGTSIKRSSASTEFYKRGDYIPGVWVDGMDVLACREAARYAIEHCTSGKGPLIMEMETYRFTGHSMSDPGTSYRKREEVKQMRENRDPIKVFREKVTSTGLVTAEKLKEIANRIREEVNDASERMKVEKESGPEDLAADIYRKNLHPFIRGIRPDAPLAHANFYKQEDDFIPLEKKKAAAPVVSTSSSKFSTKSEATFEIKPYKLHKLEQGPATSATLSSEDALKMYEKLAMLRRIETASGNLYKEKIIRGFCHLYSGAGIALAHKYRGDGGVCFTLYGDGAANQGQLFEAYNMAKLWDLPCVFVCENNGYGMGTSVDRSSASTDYYSRGDYVPGIWVDGMDVIATREATRYAIDYCNSGKGPLVMEMETYRYSGHSMSDPGTSYRTRDEVQEVRQTRDPITSFKEKILSRELVTPDQLKEIDAQVRKEVDEATKQAKSEPEVGQEELTGDIYRNNLESLIRGLHPAAPLQHYEVAPRN